MESCKICVALLVCVASVLVNAADDDYTHQCVISKTSGIPDVEVDGVVKFKQPTADGDVTIDVNVAYAGAVKDSKHGFHVHAEGKTTNQCKDAGGHFNPTTKNHGAPADTDRHVGDLGNMVADANGKLIKTFTDSVISLTGTNNIVGKAIVIHQDEDDLGKGGEEDSLTTGHAGARVGCCVIEKIDDDNGASVAGAHSVLLLTLLSVFYFLTRL